MTRYIATLFDYTNIVPLLTIVKDEKGSKIYNLFHKGTGRKLKDVYIDLDEIRELFKNEKIICNDFKSHLKAFNLPLNHQYDVYDPCVVRPDRSHDLENSKKNTVVMLSQLLKHTPQIWSNLVAKASVPYQYIEDRGYLHFGKLKHPIFFLDTFSGRARSTKFSIHGMGENEDIRSVDRNREVFIQFDWISADIRMGSFLANDEILSSVYQDSDPYSYIADNIDLPRDEVKQMFMRALYNGNFDDIIFELYDGFAEWMKEIHRKIDNGEAVCNIIGRPYFPVEKHHTGSHDKKATANALLQGSIAAALQAVTTKMYDIDKEVLFVDRYDSIVCACSFSAAKDVIKEVGDMMYKPFAGILDEEYTMPYKVSIGKEWMKWKEIKTVR